MKSPKPDLATANPLTMAEVARRAGVAESTVSRALADNPLVSEPTRRRIQALAKQLGYSINPVAQSLRVQRSRTIAVAVPLVHEARQPLSDPFLMSMLAQIADALAERGYSMLLSKVPAHDDDWIDRFLQPGRADGVILIGQSHEHSTINLAAQRGRPLVVWGARLPDQRYACVGTDNAIGGAIATRHLLQQGRRRLAFLGDERLPEIGFRYAGYRQALKEAGLRAEPALRIRTRFNADDAYGGVSRALANGIQFDGVVAASDVIATSALRALAEAGRRVPDDVAVVGFDDVELARYTLPPLTTVHQDVERGARLLVEMLLDGRCACEDSVQMAPVLVRRASA
ncbi:LacI family DNA-binding transcriptional regulator [Aquimonas sp.]|jgi:DNA-binding LacI/PurR family transcriptional regulator|uniref:LacI family DNA-binding transcriptional regulator n=1 Tax=Aquimonas sp. TaxID=1872588 RepID=UPI0037BF5B26